MRTPPFLLFGVPVLVAIGAVGSFLTPSAMGEPSDSSTAATDSSGTSPDPETGHKHGKHHHHLLSQLNLTDAQKEQIAQIRQTVTDKKERHHAIMKVLTSEQRAQLKELRKQRKLSHADNAVPTASTGT